MPLIDSPAAMKALGEEVGRAARPGDVFLLEGPFGAGKTTFVQGLGTGLGVVDAISSPSYVLATRYQGRLPLYHADLYRLVRLDEAFLQELEEQVFGDGVAALEWPEQLPRSWRTEPGVTTINFQLQADGRRLVSASPAHSVVTRVLEARAGG